MAEIASSNLLPLLDQALRERGVSASVYVVGGAAVAVLVSDRRVTRDVDVATLDPEVVALATPLRTDAGSNGCWMNEMEPAEWRCSG